MVNERVKASKLSKIISILILMKMQIRDCFTNHYVNFAYYINVYIYFNIIQKIMQIYNHILLTLSDMY